MSRLSILPQKKRLMDIDPPKEVDPGWSWFQLTMLRLNVGQGQQRVGGSSEMAKLLKGGKNSDVLECDVKCRVLVGLFVLCVPIPLLLVYAKKSLRYAETCRL